jgi:hypothetical protein
MRLLLGSRNFSIADRFGLSGLASFATANG